MRRAGRNYWSDPWNFWDWANICSFIVMAAARYQAYRGMSSLRTQMAESPDDSYFNFQNVAAYAEMESTATAFSAVLTYLKVLAYLARVPRLKLEAPGQSIQECWVKAVDVGRDRLRLTLVPPGPERDDPTLYGRRTSPLDEEEEDEMAPRWTD